MIRILLIGGRGFIGTNIVKYVYEKLLPGEVELFVLSRTNYKGQFIQDNINYVTGDYKDLEFMNALFKQKNFTSVFHFASTTIPVSSNQNIIGDIHDNLLATVNLLEVMKNNNCNFILYLSSGGAVYGEFTQDLLDEMHPCEPISSYGVIKFTIEQYIKLYHKQNGLNYLILRVSNPYGPFHTSEKQGVVNIAIRKAINNLPLSVWGTGEQSKDYIYVEDIAHIVWLLTKAEVRNEIINVGSGSAVSLNVILSQIKDFESDFKVVHEKSLPSDVKTFCLDTTKLKNIVSFDLTPLESGLMKTLEWEKKVKNG